MASLDYYGIEELLTDEERAARETERAGLLTKKCGRSWCNVTAKVASRSSSFRGWARCVSLRRTCKDTGVPD